MDIDKILAELIEERRLIDQAIVRLEQVERSRKHGAESAKPSQEARQGEQDGGERPGYSQAMRHM